MGFIVSSRYPILPCLFGLLLLSQPTECRELQSCSSCVAPIEFRSDRYKSKYTIGVLGIRGEATAYSQYQATFADYLTATAGKRFDPPIEFEMKYINFTAMYDSTRDQTIDFAYVNPSASACLDIEYGAQLLPSIISQAVVGGQTSFLSEFGGLIITRADNDDIRTIEDLKDKVVSAVSIAGFGAALLQFQEMQKAGMSYINDPSQIVFTSNQQLTLKGVLTGEFDAGFIRTGIIEKTKDENGNPIDASLLKILQPRQDESDGAAFPYVHSTPLYPEWSLAALRHVASDISREVQHALLILADHARTGRAVEDCFYANGENATICQDFEALDPQVRCDTTTAVAQAASRASANGGYKGFRTTLAYNDVRGVLQDTGFVSKIEGTNTRQCRRPKELHDSIVCPEGYFKKSKESFDEACSEAGLECAEGYQCACKPCFKASEIEVAPAELYKPGAGCPKMSICGAAQQTKPVVFYVVDNKEDREVLIPTVVMHDGDEQREIVVMQRPSPNVYEFEISSKHVGSVILEIFVGGEQIPSSPLRLQVQARDCSLDYNRGHRVADEEGNCVCKVNAFTFGDSCAPKSIFFTALLVPICIAVIVGLYMHIKKKEKEADSLWLIKEEELLYQSPPQVIGEGSFGLVLLAEYRGSKVAVKHFLPLYKKEDEEQMVKRKLPASSASSRARCCGDNTSVVENSETSGDDIEQALRGDSDVKSNDKSPVQNALQAKWKTSTTNFKKSGRTHRSSNRTLSNMTGGFVKEMRILSNLRHPNITTVMGAVMTKKSPMLVMEYMDHGALYEVLHNPTMVIEPKLMLEIMQDITQGLRFLHSSNPPVIHGDLKSANILLDSKFRAKLSDLRLSNKNLDQATGTPLWMAPELLRCETLNTPESDMYSIGIILNEMYSLQDPYEDACSEDLLSLVSDRTINKRPTIHKDCPPKVKKLIKFLWHAEPKHRLSVKELENRLNELGVADIAPMSENLNNQIAKQRPELSYEEFLYQVFPRHVADVLKRGEKVEPESHDLVTIFFSDIIGFTTIASSFEPLKVSSLLDRLYLKFDDLARKYELFKIETIGDAYMCAGNLASDQTNDHVKRIASFAADAIKAAAETPIDVDDLDRGMIYIRVGFHSGPVVSNVVGSLNPRYGVFGDTVNVASRMESTSDGGRIHCSKQSANLLRQQAPEIPVSLHGETPIKGRGIMTTFWVN